MTPLEVYWLPATSKIRYMLRLTTSPYSLAPIPTRRSSGAHGSTSRPFVVFFLLGTSFIFPDLYICKLSPAVIHVSLHSANGVWHGGNGYTVVDLLFLVRFVKLGIAGYLSLTYEVFNTRVGFCPGHSSLHVPPMYYNYCPVNKWRKGPTLELD